MKIEDKFYKFMLAGHEKCFSLIDEYGAQIFRNAVSYGSLNNIEFDWQSEGSRGFFVHDLCMRFDNPKSFLNGAIDKYLLSETDNNPYLFYHLTDFICAFAWDDVTQDEDAINALDKKYNELYARMNTEDEIKCFEYLSICLAQNKGKDTVAGILNDIGEFFTRQNETQNKNFQNDFMWFTDELTDCFGEDSAKVDFWTKDYNGDAKGINYFFEIMKDVIENKNDTENLSAKIETAKEYIEKAHNNALSKKDKIIFRYKADDSEKAKLIDEVISENNPDIKAVLLEGITGKDCAKGNLHNYLFEYVKSDCAALKKAALDVLSEIRNKAVYDYALRLFDDGKTKDALPLLLHNYQEVDKEKILDALNDLEIDREDKSGWHEIVKKIIEVASDGEVNLPDEFLIWVSENSMCSFCRESVSQ